jgi:arylsulfatase A-like enzyme
MPKRPNILFLIMDDQRPDTVGPDSAFPVNTPNLDKLAAGGTQFRRHYVTTPICTPGRAEVLTGQHSYHNGARWFGQPRPFLCCGFTSPDADPDQPLRETQRMIVDEDWKLILYPQTGQRLLYHLAADPDEADELEGQLRTWSAANGDPLYTK